MARSETDLLCHRIVWRNEYRWDVYRDESSSASDYAEDEDDMEGMVFLDSASSFTEAQRITEADRIACLATSVALAAE